MTKNIFNKTVVTLVISVAILLTGFKSYEKGQWANSETYPELIAKNISVEQAKEKMPKKELISHFQTICGHFSKEIAVAEKNNGTFVRCGKSWLSGVYAVRFKQSNSAQ
ncbi:hypothetical protein U0129_21090 [Enterobacter hormaechei]|uniref:hypothetical protein n=1 Tax=Enterobacter hormaechei TaxID=158836 RepID=UPI0039C0F63D